MTTKYTHTIQITGNKRSCGTSDSSKRESTTRRYVACLVATTTERTVALQTAKRNELSAEKAEVETKLAAECARQGLTVEQAKEELHRLAVIWNKEANYYGVCRRIADELMAANPGKYSSSFTLSLSDEVIVLAKAELAARGYKCPDDENGLKEIAHLDWRRSCLEDNINRNSDELGSQAVLSWHLTAANATQALNAREAEYRRQQGDNVEIRTDIQVVEHTVKSRKAVKGTEPHAE
jgi:hypothetical protein